MEKDKNTPLANCGHGFVPLALAFYLAVFHNGWRGLWPPSCWSVDFDSWWDLLLRQLWENGEGRKPGTWVFRSTISRWLMEFSARSLFVVGCARSAITHTAHTFPQRAVIRRTVCISVQRQLALARFREPLIPGVFVLPLWKMNRECYIIGTQLPMPQTGNYACGRWRNTHAKGPFPNELQRTCAYIKHPNGSLTHLVIPTQWLIILNGPNAEKSIGIDLLNTLFAGNIIERVNALQRTRARYLANFFTCHWFATSSHKNSRY